MNAYTFLYPSMTVHKAGCADIKRTLTKGKVAADTMGKVEADSVRDAIAKELRGDLEEMGYTAADFNVAPCAR